MEHKQLQALLPVVTSKIVPLMARYIGLSAFAPSCCFNSLRVSSLRGTTWMQQVANDDVRGVQMQCQDVASKV